MNIRSDKKEGSKTTRGATTKAVTGKNLRRRSPRVEHLEQRQLLAATTPDWFSLDGSVEAYDVGAVFTHGSIASAPESQISTDVLGQPRLDLLPKIVLTDLESGPSTFRIGDQVDEPNAYVHDGTLRRSLVPAQIEIDPNLSYELRAETLDIPSVRALRIQAVVSDADGLPIQPIHVRRFSGATDTTLLMDVSPGDTSIVVADASGWSQADGSSVTTRALAWFGYQDAAGTTHADYTYTRYTLGDAENAAWPIGGISPDTSSGGYRITLNQPWSGESVPAGTAIRNAVSEQRDFTLVHQTVREDKSYVRRPLLQESQIVQTRALVGGQAWDAESEMQSAMPPGTHSIVLAASNPLVNITFGFLNRSTSPITIDGQRRVVATNSLQSISSDAARVIDPNDTNYFGVTASVRTTDDQPSPAETHSIGYQAVDRDGHLIESTHVTRYATAVDTTLAQSLTAGDTQIVLTDGSGWSNQASPATRTLAWYGYENALGETYPDYSYTRNIAGDPINGLWPVGGVTGNVITLSQPWSGQTLPAGTAVRNTETGDSLQRVVLSGAALTATPTRYVSSAVSGFWQNGIADAASFPPGTGAVRIAAIANERNFTQDDIVVLEGFSIANSPSDLQIVQPVNRQHTLMLDVLANDSSHVTLTGLDDPQFGTAVIESGKIRYTSAANFIGVDRFSYTVADTETGETSTEIVSVAITGGNHDQDAVLAQGLIDNESVTAIRRDPVAHDENFLPIPYRVAQNSVLTVDGLSHTGLLNNDSVTGLPVEDGSVVGLATPPNHGSLQLNPDGTFTYIPDFGYVGSDQFRYTIFDGLRTDTAVAIVETLADARAVVSANLETLMLQFRNFHSAFTELPADRVAAADPTQAGVPRLSWRVHLLPFLGYHELYSQFHLDEPWDSAHNLPLASAMPEIFGDGLSVGETTTRIQALTSSPFRTIDNPIGPVGLRNDGIATKFRDVLDGLSNSILLVQTSADRAVPWTAPQDAVFDYSDPLSTLGTLDPQGILVGMFDGTVADLPADLSEEAFVALSTRADKDNESINFDAILRVQDADAWDQNGARQDENLTQIGLGLQNWHSAYNSLPPNPGTPRQADGQFRFSWRVYLLPFIEHQSLHEQFDFYQPWDSPHNLSLLDKMPDIFRSTGDSPDSFITRVQMVMGPGAAYDVDDTGLVVASRFSDFADGLENTLMVVETGPERAALWTRPDEFDFDPADPVASLGSLPDGFFRAIKADGQVVRLPADIEPEQFAAMLTRDATEHYATDAVPLQEYVPLDSLTRKHRDLNGAEFSSEQANKFKVVGLGFHNYRSAFRQLPIMDDPAFYDADGKPFLSWRVHLLPFIGFPLLYQQFDLQEPWDSPNNLPLMQSMPDVFRDSDSAWDSTTTRIQLFVDGGTPENGFRDGALFRSTRTRIDFRDVLDGLSNTVLAVQAGKDVAVPWTKPADITFDPQDPYSGLGDIGDRLPVLFADGGTSWLPIIPDQQLANLIRPNDRNGLAAEQLVLKANETVLLESSGAITFSAEFYDRERSWSTFPTFETRTVDVVAADPSLVEVFPKQLTFTVNDLEIPRHITVRAIDDGSVDGPRNTTITIDGQVIEVTIVDDENGTAGQEYGDAPLPYPGSANHLPTGPRLGLVRDVESGTQRSEDADGDGADEDGVLFGIVSPANSVAAVNINVQNSADAFIDAWVDFNADGDWDDLGEQIMASTPVTRGLQTLNYDVPSDAGVGQTFARIRISSSGGLSPSDSAQDGEVEDYAIAIGSDPAGIGSTNINAGQPSRSELSSVEVQFDSLVPVSADDFILRNTDTDEIVTGILVAVDGSSGRTVATLTFTGGNSVISGPEPSMPPTLADGHYTLRYLPSETPGNTQPIDSFYRKFGDTDADGSVGLSDFASFRTAFGSSIDEDEFDASLDSNRDGQVSLSDFAAFRSSFGQ
ncbi:DUF1559 domain-containing protein [Rubripirellula obstinata]|nr:DUF1559 domain-containing protein [Rubripirellula obstinata]